MSESPFGMKLPLRYAEGTIGNFEDSDGETIGLINQVSSNDREESHATRIARTYYIIRAVNSHDDLIAACELALSFNRDGCPDPNCNVCKRHRAETAQIKAAILKATK